MSVLFTVVMMAVYAVAALVFWGGCARLGWMMGQGRG